MTRHPGDDASAEALRQAIARITELESENVRLLAVISGRMGREAELEDALVLLRDAVLHGLGAGEVEDALTAAVAALDGSVTNQVAG